MWKVTRWILFVLAMLLALAHVESLGSALGQVAGGIADLFTGMDGGAPENLLYHHDPAVQLLSWGVLGTWLLGMWIIAWKNWANRRDDSS